MFSDEATTRTSAQPGPGLRVGHVAQHQPGQRVGGALRDGDCSKHGHNRARDDGRSLGVPCDGTRAVGSAGTRGCLCPMTSTIEPTTAQEAARHASAPPRGATRARGALDRPAELQRTLDVSGLVDAEGGLLDRAIFTDEPLYRQELRRVFAPSWLFLAHTDQFHKPGDFFTTYMGEDPVIVTMDKNRRIRAYLNSCRHRGARVCRADTAQTRNFTCTYHGWSYDLEGKLVSVPNKEGYPDSFRPDDWGLVEVPHVETYHGLIFGTWNPEPVVAA